MMKKKWTTLKRNWVRKFSKTAVNSQEKILEILREMENFNKRGYVKYKEFLEISPTLERVIRKYLKNGIEIEDLSDKALKRIIWWCYNEIILESYLEISKNLKEKDEEDDKDIDTRNLLKVLLMKLDPSIRIKIQDRGMTILKNIYTGFDTEYQAQGMNRNKLLSVQLAVNTKTTLILPYVKDYKIVKIDPITSKVYSIEKNEEEYDYEKIEENLRAKIKEIREVKFSKKDASIRNLIKGLIEKGIPYIIRGDNICFTLDRTPIKQWFMKVGEEGYTMEEIIGISNNIAKPTLEEEEEKLLKILKALYEEWKEKGEVEKDVEIKEKSEEGMKKVTSIPIIKIEEKEEISKEAIGKTKYTRTTNRTFTNGNINITRRINNNIIGHYTSADLSVLKDFEKIKEGLDIVNGNLVTLRKPLFIKGVNVIIRDTILLAPASKKSLANLGEMYGEDYKKINIKKTWYDNMEEFMKEHYEEFKEYAMRDTLITLIHASYMEDVNFKQGIIGIPVTLSSLSASYIRKKWKEDGYKGYQLASKLLGEPNELLTPKSINENGLIAVNLGMYIASYRGGRNESYMYGMEKETTWYDYDITSAYTTAMALLGNPNYKNARRLTAKELLEMEEMKILYSYTVIKVKFEFPEETKFPSIPCQVDKGTTVYPIKGEAYIQGSEYLLAKNQKCKINIEDVFHIPFYAEEGEKITCNIDKVANLQNLYKPFKDCIEELQAMRRSYPKGTIDNLIYKDMGNSIYGLVSKGISNKMKYDTKIKDYSRIKANDLSNPIMASWITAFIRSVIGEMLHNTSELGGKIVSVTTDGFITDKENLENLLLNKEGSKLFLNEYRKIRKSLSDDWTSLEVKNSGKGIISWTTRGQFSYEANIAATTGLQRRYYTKEELQELLQETLESEKKVVSTIERSLRSSVEIFKKGGSVTTVLKDKTFRMLYDNRRNIIGEQNATAELLDSKPIKDVNQCDLNRFISKLPIKEEYYKNSAQLSIKSQYKSYLELAVRTFIRGLLMGNYNLDVNYFKNYKEIVQFIKGYKETYRINENTISLLKRRTVSRVRKVPEKPEIKEFIEYVKRTFPNFDEKSFFN